MNRYEQFWGKKVFSRFSMFFFYKKKTSACWNCTYPFKRNSLLQNSLLHLEFKNSFWVGSGNGFLFVSPFSNWFSKNQCNGARIRIVRMIPWLSRIPPHKVLIVTSKQETTAHHLQVSTELLTGAFGPGCRVWADFGDFSDFRGGVCRAHGRHRGSCATPLAGFGHEIW